MLLTNSPTLLNGAGLLFVAYALNFLRNSLLSKVYKFLHNI
nr:MAG TPA: hypothetical protein [Caudoviricetes sp.]